MPDPNPSDAARDVCPACGQPIPLPADPVLGEVLWCDHCGAELELVSTEPIRLDLFEEEEK
ncbi:MAG: lysine biosynthesis protein LysW [Caldilineae bacterium]|nr:lysine biosynthesis protein LysW [Chloroflexota bacterium]MCB9175564.1 lysine biosynthesis protein LysW [Caldilineae bacterium]